MESRVGQHLSELRHALESFHVVSCRVLHERVLFRDGSAVRRHANGVESSLARVGLCTWNERKGQLACAHTTSRHQLVELANLFAAEGVITEVEARSIEERITRLANVIHSIDWSKRVLEAAYARTVESRAVAASITLRAEIDRLEAEHTVASIALRDILDCMTRALGVVKA